MARGRKRPAAGRWLGAGLLLGLVAAGVGWWEMGAWKPGRGRFPVQGIVTSGRDAAIDWTALEATGGDFAYLRASTGGKRDLKFQEALAGARKAGLKVGALHHYDPCRGADEQAAAFVTTVPRDAKLLPPAVELELVDGECAAPPAPEALASELTTFLNQIEAHAGKPAILKPSRGFERRYGVAAMIDRNLWVTGDYLAPGYPGRPWVMWTANDRLRSPASDEALRWVVVQP